MAEHGKMGNMGGNMGTDGIFWTDYKQTWDY